MSYVIQNFNIINKNIIVTSRFKLLLIFLNNDFFFLLFRINLFLKISNKRFHITYESFFYLFKFLFMTNTVKYVLYVNSTVVGNYNNNLQKSLICNNLMNFNKFFDNKIKIHKEILNENFLTYNSYFVAIKIINFPINKTIYENFFFFYF